MKKPREGLCCIQRQHPSGGLVGRAVLGLECRGMAESIRNRPTQLDPSSSNPWVDAYSLLTTTVDSSRAASRPTPITYSATSAESPPCAWSLLLLVAAAKFCKWFRLRLAHQRLLQALLIQTQLFQQLLHQHRQQAKF